MTGALPALPLPGLVVTVGDTRPVQESMPFALPKLQLIRPDIAMPHMVPDGRVPAIAAQLRANVPGVRVWIQTPGNSLAAEAPGVRIEATVRQWVRNCIAAGAEVLSLNCEGAGHPGGLGWKRGQPLTGTQLVARARLVVDVAADEAAGRLVIGVSTHDRWRSHAVDGLPVGTWYAPSSRVQLAINQEYPADPPRVIARREAMQRHDGTAEQLHDLVARGVVRRDLATDGAGYVLYTQAHHLTTDAACCLHDLSALSAAWTLEPGVCDAAGILALRVDARMRAAVGHEPGRIRRYQHSVGVEITGRVDAPTLAALGLT